MGFDDRGKVRLNMKFVNQDTGEEYPREEKPESKDAKKDDDKKGNNKRRRRRRPAKSEEEE